MREDTKKEMEDLVTVLKAMNSIPWAKLDELTIDWEVVRNDGFVHKILPKVKIRIKDSDYA